MRGIRTPAPRRGRARFAGLVLLAGSSAAWAQSAALATGSAGAAIAPPDFPDVEVLRKAPGRAPGLLLVTPYYSAPEQDGPVAFLAIIDDDGAVHFQRRVSPAAHNFRWHERAGRYSYNEAPPNGAGDVVLLDERLEEVARVRPVAGLAPAMMHEFLITDEGNYLFVVNQPAVRDLGRYLAPADAPPEPSNAASSDTEPPGAAPNRADLSGTASSKAAPSGTAPSNPVLTSAEPSSFDPSNSSSPNTAPTQDLVIEEATSAGRPAPSNPTPVFDSIIQEVTPDGREVFRWNAWGHIKLSDCLWSLFPREYAKLNSLQLSGGDLIASFRGCSTVLKIERPSGRVLWQFGGSDPVAPDPYDARRPTFERPWHRPTGDPRGGFCAQHTALETAPGRILMFDNGTCPDGNRPSSRVVEYQLGPLGEAASESPGQDVETAAGSHDPGRGTLHRRPGAVGALAHRPGPNSYEATFIRHHEPQPGRLAVYGGAVAPLPNGNWLISWGAGPGDATLSEVDSSGAEVLALRLSKDPHPAMSYRVWRKPADTGGR